MAHPIDDESGEQARALPKWHGITRPFSVHTSLGSPLVFPEQITAPASCWPLTIVSTRYGGVYEQGAFAAFPLDTDRLPDEWDGSDNECDDFWRNARARKLPIGVGNTPDAALADLMRHLHDDNGRA